jgi:hypothetical protein
MTHHFNYLLIKLLKHINIIIEYEFFLFDEIFKNNTKLTSKLMFKYYNGIQLLLQMLKQSSNLLVVD